MKGNGRIRVAVLCILVAAALIAGAGLAGKAFAHRHRDCGGESACCCCPDGGRMADCGRERGCREQNRDGMPPMMEGMKEHAADVRKAVEALRASEKKLEGTTDPAAFRAGVLAHLKLVDDLQAAHLKHMETMAGRAIRDGKKPCKEGCKEPCDEPCGDSGKQPCAKCPQGKGAGPAPK